MRPHMAPSTETPNRHSPLPHGHASFSREGPLPAIVLRRCWHTVLWELEDGREEATRVKPPHRPHWVRALQHQVDLHERMETVILQPFRLNAVETPC